MSLFDFAGFSWFNPAPEVNMEQLVKGFWHYLRLWKQKYSKPLSLQWKDNWLKNDYCATCRYCCGKQDSNTPFPMALLPHQVGPHLEEFFFLLDPETAYLDARGCKSSGHEGCKLQREQRPFSCGLFPLVLANGRMYLYKTCPAVLLTPLADMAEIGMAAATMLASLPLNDLQRISLDLDAATLAEKYISLQITVFDATGIVLRQD